jgi:RHS repeat-associated protein
MNAVSCPTSSFCAAVDTSGNAVILNGTSWSPAVNSDGSMSINGVACTSATFCEGVDSSGEAQPYKINNVTSQLIWNTTGELPQVVSDGLNYYVYGPTGEPIEQVNTTATPPVNNPAFLTYTPSDSSWLVTNTAGNEMNFYRYDAFGSLAFGTSSSSFGFAGQYQDSPTSSSGFNNMRARWYDPQTGAFTTRDPAFSQTGQAYDYAGGDPVNQTDPSGTCTGFFDFFCNFHNGQWLDAASNSPNGQVAATYKNVYNLFTSNGWSANDATIATRSFNWHKPVVVIAGEPPYAYYRYTSQRVVGRTAFGTPSVYTSSTAAVNDLNLGVSGNTGKFAWLIGVLAPTPIVYGYAAGSSTGGGLQFVVPEWATVTAVVNGPVRTALAYTLSPTRQPIGLPGVTLSSLNSAPTSGCVET